MRDGPLDMRMDTDRGETAADYLARVTETELKRVLTVWRRTQRGAHCTRHRDCA